VSSPLDEDLNADHDNGLGVGAATLAAEDPDDYIRAKRLQQIYQARERVTDRAVATDEYVATGQMQHEARQVILYHVVEAYVRELMPLAHDHAEQTGDAAYLYDTTLGYVQLTQAEPIEIRGLAGFRDAEPVYVETVTEEIEYPQGPPQHQERQMDHFMPEAISWAAYDLANEFTRAVDLDVPLDDSTNEWEI
jgi:hypothetical protein